jgi:hypothetical protein
VGGDRQRTLGVTRSQVCFVNQYVSEYHQK